MGRRRQRHFNPATAGCHVALDARFGVTLIGGDVSRWDGRSGTSFYSQDAGYPSTPIDAPVIGSINGQQAFNFNGDTLYMTNGSVFPSWSPLQSMFVCAWLNTTNTDYQRIVSSVADVYAFIGCKYVTTPPPPTVPIATFMGNGSAWNDIDPNSPTVDSQYPFALCSKRKDFNGSFYPLETTANTVVQTEKAASILNIAMGAIGGNSPQYWQGQIAMVAFGQTTGVPMDRRILQMMGRVWRIHTL
jgi:hypothetical protein